MMKNDEIIRLLTNENGPEQISLMTREELVASFGMPFGVLKGYDQNNPHHHLDLLEHTTEVIKGIQHQNLNEEDAVALLLAALLHDIGKPIVAKSKNGRTVYYGHPLASRQIAEEQLRLYGFTSEVIQRVLFFIHYHDTFINFKLSDELVDWNLRFFCSRTSIIHSARISV